MELRPRCYRHPESEATVSCQRCGRPICTKCMIPAAVGFQCPECVSRGNRETRQVEGPYGGARDQHPTVLSRVLIGINFAVWLAILLTGQAHSTLIKLLALVPAGVCLDGTNPDQYYPEVTKVLCTAQPGTLWLDGVASGAYWQLITNAFTHVGILHIAFNMFALWVLGPQLEAVFGRARYLSLYFLSALTASTLVMWLSSPSQVTLGASGAIFGLMGAILIVAIKQGGDVRTILFWLGANIAITFIGQSFISWQGHVGGLLGGILVGLAIVYAPRVHRSRFQWFCLSGVTAVLLIAIAIRITQLA